MKIKIKTLLYIIFGVLIFLIGIIVGGLMGTYALIDHITHGLSGSTFIVNFNETKMIQEFNKTIMPNILNSLKEK